MTISSIQIGDFNILKAFLGNVVIYHKVLGYNPVTLFAQGQQGLLYDPRNINDLFQDAAGTIKVATSGDPIGFMRDKSGNGNHAKELTSAGRPIYQSGSTYYDGVDDTLKIAWLNRPAIVDLITVVKIPVGAPAFVIFTGYANLAEAFFGVGQSGSASTLVSSNNTANSVGTLYIDGVDKTGITRGGLYTALADGIKHIVEFRGVNVSDNVRWNEVRLFNYRNSLVLKGIVGVTLMRGSLTTTEREALYTYLNGVTL